MLNKEKLKNFLVNPEFKFWTMVVLLLTIIGFQISSYLSARRIRRFMHRGAGLYSDFLKENGDFLNGNNFRMDKIKQMEKRLDEKLSKFERETGIYRSKREGNFDKQLDLAKTQKTQRRGLFVFKPKSLYRENEKEFVVTFRAPKNLTQDDIGVNFNKNTLVINIEKSQNTNSGYSYDSFTQTFTTPETKTDVKDIKTTIENGKVSVIVPIM